MKTSADLLLARLQTELRLGNYESQRELADRIGVDKATLNRWLNGKQRPNPSLEQLENIALEFGIPVSDLVSKEAPPPRVRPRETTAPPQPSIDAVRLKRELGAIAERLVRAAQLIPEKEP